MQIPISIIFGEKDEYFDALEAAQNAPHFNVEIMAEINDVNYNSMGISKRPIVTFKSLIKASKGTGATEQIGNLYVVQNGNHNLNNTPDVKTALRNILQDELS